jgi:hypothetical protein
MCGPMSRRSDAAMSPDLYLILAWIGRVGVIIAWLVLIPEAARLGLQTAGLWQDHYWPLFAGNVIMSMAALLLFQLI